MNPRLRALADSYLALRRASGYRLEDAGRLIGQFVSWLGDGRPAPGAFTPADAVEWACLPGKSPQHHANRLSAVRGWAAYAHAHDPKLPTIPVGLIPETRPRSVPYIYQPQQIAGIMDVFAAGARKARTWRSRWINTTARALTGLLACTGMRVGEALSLNSADIDHASGWVTVVSEKTGVERLVMLHETALAELSGYSAHPDRPTRADHSRPLFVCSSGTRTLYGNYQRAFHQAVQEAGVEPIRQAKPTVHSLRHTFAVDQITAAYRDGADPARRLSLLSTWLGHSSPANTYWYLSATPELLGQAARLLEPEGGADS
jgi:integrase